MLRLTNVRSAIALALALIGCVAFASAQQPKSAPAPQKKTAPAPQTKAAPASQSTSDDPREANLTAYSELLRSDIRAQKTAIIAQVLQLDEAEDAKFWPVYREYESELMKINDDRLTLIKEYALKYDKLTDADADRMATSALDLEARRNTLKSKYYDQLKAVLPAKTAARALQVENQIMLLLDLQIAASLPIAQ